MIDWLRRLWLAPRETPLQGVPAHRRQKTYSALSGYVFQYVYAGYRPIPEPPSVDYVFLVGTQRAASQPLAVRVEDAIEAHMSDRSERPISPREKYALAKMKLFRVLDELQPGPQPHFPPGQVFVLSAVEAAEFWEILEL